jgi:hypothetical protein
MEFRKMKFKVVSLKFCKGERKIHPRTGHEGPEGE